MTIKYIKQKMAAPGFIGSLILATFAPVQTSQGTSDLPNQDPIELPADNSVPAHGFQKAINHLGEGENNILSAICGQKAVNPFVGVNGTENAADPLDQNTPLQFAQTGNPLIKVRDSANNLRYVEVLWEGKSGEGRGRYEDDFGTLRKVVWNARRVIQTDEGVNHPLYEATVGTPEVEPIKSLYEGIGNTATIVKRNGNGTISEHPGDLVSRLSEIQAGMDELHSALPANTAESFQAMQLGLSTQMARLDIRLENIEKALAAERDQTLNVRLQRLETEVDKLTWMVHQLCLFSRHLHCEHAKINNTNLINVPDHWNPNH